MRTKKEITCIICPVGCKILVKADGKKVEVLTGEKCKKGIEYAIHEALDPRRMLTTSIFVDDGTWPLVSVKSSKPVPKNKVFDVLKEIKKSRAKAPIASGQILIKNVAGVGLDIVATKTVDKIKK
jgi:CxxC motif-containing protein